ncbi:MAG: tetratricopeptide repeat protein [Deltaproteobacteria bacterium]|nr:tetratricopeptide repeat protein [Candidatus Anaeroferrophillus wilburensis]MBN2889655.1 tetratricopeptide repeat protein [Deltaproteobacteria bacterium]
MSEIKKIAGYYSEKVKISLGTGATRRQTTGENIFLVKELPDGRVELSLLNMDGEPTRIKEVVELDEFQRRCTPKPDYLPLGQKIDQGHLRKKVQADKHASRGNLHLKRKEYNSAEFEYGSALKLDEENVRANYGLGKVHLERGEVEEARKVFGKLAQIEALFQEENKHVFNEFGIDLRQNKMYDEAIANYKKALEIGVQDPVLLFNLGRAYVEKGQWSEALVCLQKAMMMRQDFPEAEKLAAIVQGKLIHADDAS